MLSIDSNWSNWSNWEQLERCFHLHHPSSLLITFAIFSNNTRGIDNSATKSRKWLFCQFMPIKTRILILNLSPFSLGITRWVTYLGYRYLVSKTLSQPNWTLTSTVIIIIHIFILCEKFFNFRFGNQTNKNSHKISPKLVANWYRSYWFAFVLLWYMYIYIYMCMYVYMSLIFFRSWPSTDPQRAPGLVPKRLTEIAVQKESWGVFKESQNIVKNEWKIIQTPKSFRTALNWSKSAQPENQWGFHGEISVSYKQNRDGILCWLFWKLQIDSHPPSQKKLNNLFLSQLHLEIQLWNPQYQ